MLIFSLVAKTMWKKWETKGLALSMSRMPGVSVYSELQGYLSAASDTKAPGVPRHFPMTFKHNSNE